MPESEPATVGERLTSRPQAIVPPLPTRIQLKSAPHAYAVYEASGYAEVRVSVQGDGTVLQVDGDGQYVKSLLVRALAALDEADKSRQGRARGHGEA